MGLFSKLVNVAVNVVQLPVDVVKDKWTLGGALAGREESYTVERVKKLADAADGVVDEFKD